MRSDMHITPSTHMCVSYVLVDVCMENMKIKTMKESKEWGVVSLEVLVGMDHI